LISARNKFRGTITDIKLKDIIGEVRVKLKGTIRVKCVITWEAAEELNLKAGDKVSALIKATEVMIEKK